MLRFVPTFRNVVITAGLLASTVLSAQTFTRTQTISVDDPRLVKLADVNGDGNLDLIYNSSTSALLSVRLGNGNGTFQTTGPDYTIFSVNEFEFPDINKDGEIDMVTTGDVATVQTFLGSGNGTFTFYKDQAAVQACNHSDETNSLSVVDVNHDGKLDVVASTSCLAILFLGNGDGSFQPGTVIADEGPGLHDLEAGDFNKDGNVDIAFGVPSTGSSDPGTLYVAYGDGAGHFAPRTAIGLADYTGLKVKDINNDGFADILALHGVPVVFYGSSSRFNAKLGDSFNGYQQTSISFGDLNNDGSTDIVTSAYTTLPRAGEDDGVLIYPRNSDGSLLDANLVSLGSNFSVQPTEVVAGDINGDGKDDIVVAGNNTNQIIVLTNKGGNGTFCSAPTESFTVHFCTPANGSTVPSPVHVATTGFAAGIISGSKVYINGTAKYASTGAVIQADFALAAGTYRITAKYWDNVGNVFSSTRNITVGSGGGNSCSVPSSAGLHLCAPTDGASVASPVTVSAAAKAAVKISGMKVYIDGTSKFSTTTSSLSQSFYLSAGSHHITVKAWDTNGAVYSKSVTITVH